MVSREREGILGSPSLAWEIPAHVINIAERVQSLSFGRQRSEYMAILHVGMIRVYAKLLGEANAKGGF